ncbi:hypothetical protein CC79DRAFT_1367556 [Sarocladium strictum]
MIFTKSVAVLSLGAVATVSAFPSSPAVQHIDIRDDDRWESESGDGNVRITAGSERINWGTMKPSEALEKIKDHCATNGCHGDDVLTVTSQIPGDARLEDHDINISVEGSFAKEGAQGSLNDLVDIAKELVKASFEVEEQRTSDKICTTWTMCGPQDYHDVELFLQTNRIIIRVEDDDGNQQANMAIRITTGASADGDWCSDITSIGSTVAGLVGGVGGGVFSLAGLFCG